MANSRIKNTITLFILYYITSTTSLTFFHLKNKLNYVSTNLEQKNHKLFLSSSSPSSSGNNNNDNYESKLTQEERKLNLRILENLFPTSIFPSSGNNSNNNYYFKSNDNSNRRKGKLIPLKLLGQCEINNDSSSSNSKALALNLSKNSKPIIYNNRDVKIQTSNKESILIPIPSKVIPLIESCYNSNINKEDYKPSKTQLLSLNTLLTNVDNGLFDNLPYSTWSIDNATDATGVNAIDAKYHFGKRNAYDRFLGKDWPGRSLSIGNLAKRLLVSIEEQRQEGDEEKSIDKNNDDDDISFSQESLSKRILEIELLECRTMLAQVEYDLAIYTNNHDLDKSPSEESISLQQDATKWKNRIQEIENVLQQQQEQLTSDNNTPPSSLSNTKIIKEICDKLINLNTKNPAPYRGAYGYAPYIDTTDNIKEQQSPYRNPFDLLIEIISEQLNANVIGCILENTYILDPNIIQLDGAIVLQRKFPNASSTSSMDKVMIEGKEYKVTSSKSTSNNKETNVNNVTSGDILIVECFAYEAVAMSLALNHTDILIDQALWDRLYINTNTNNDSSNMSDEKNDNYNKMVQIPTVAINEEDQDTTIKVKQEELTNDNVLSNKISSKTTSSFFSPLSSSPDDSNPVTTSSNSNVDIQSLQEYDSLSMHKRAQLILSLQPNTILPRPRTLLANVMDDKNNNDDPLNKLLLPYIDETIRRDYNIRKAEQDGDAELVKQLKEEKSKRHVLLEQMNNEKDSFDAYVRYKNEMDVCIFTSLLL